MHSFLQLVSLEEMMLFLSGGDERDSKMALDLNCLC